MANIYLSSRDAAGALLTALDEQLTRIGASYDLAVVGGAALLALGLTSRPTRDVDIVAFHAAGRLLRADPLPEDLRRARGLVARDFGVSEDWINPGPTDLLALGLPEGFLVRSERVDYGPALTVRFASRLDQVHFKLYATVDQGAGKHFRDLQALEPKREELVAAARWSRTHDPSTGFRSVLEQVLAYFEVGDANLDA